MSRLHGYEKDGCPEAVAGSDNCLHYNGYENYKRLVDQAGDHLKVVGEEYIDNRCKGMAILGIIDHGALTTSTLQSRIEYITVIESTLDANSPEEANLRLLYDSLIMNMAEDEAKDVVDYERRTELANSALKFLIYHNYDPLSVFESGGLESISFPVIPLYKRFFINNMDLLFADNWDSEKNILNIEEKNGYAQHEAALALLFEHYFGGEITQWDYYDPSGFDPLIHSHYTWNSTEVQLDINCFRKVQAVGEDKDAHKTLNDHHEGLEVVGTTINKEYLLGIPSIQSTYLEARRNLMRTEWERVVTGRTV